MTTIAFDGKTLAADSLCTGRFQYQAHSKIFDRGDSIFGAAGARDACLLFREWIEHEGTPEKRPTINDRDFEAIRVYKSGGEAVGYGAGLVPFWIPKTHAIGSGAMAAMGAMFAGADARRAVEIASLLDGFTGGEIVTLELVDGKQEIERFDARIIS